MTCNDANGIVVLIGVSGVLVITAVLLVGATILCWREVLSK